jgi:Zn-dependent protease with chaperone function
VLRQAWWRLVSFVGALLMVAAGFDEIFCGRLRGIGWLLAAGIVAKVTTALLRRSEGMKFNRLKSGELRNRALRMAGWMGVKLDRVYMVPAGKGHLTNAYGMSNAIALTDNLGKYLSKEQVDSVIAHELGHVKLKHGRRSLLLVVALFSALALISFRLSARAPLLLSVVRFVVIFAPLMVIYYVSRRFEYAADREAVALTGDHETAIRALANLYYAAEAPTRFGRFSELFATHPALLRRAYAIGKLGQIPAQRLSHILADVGLASAGAPAD